MVLATLFYQETACHFCAIAPRFQMCAPSTQKNGNGGWSSFPDSKEWKSPLPIACRKWWYQPQAQFQDTSRLRYSCGHALECMRWVLNLIVAAVVSAAEIQSVVRTFALLS